MSSSDYIQLRKIKETKNNYPYFSSANYIQTKKLCAVLDTAEVDEYGDTVPQHLFKIDILDNMNNCPPNTYTGKVTRPVFIGTPRLTTLNIKTAKALGLNF
jgi:hypothetical protein